MPILPSDPLHAEAKALGLRIHEPSWEPGRARVASRLCHDACLSSVPVSDLRAQLALFAAQDERARSMFLLGIGIGLAGNAS
jgi:hypothetical protein